MRKETEALFYDKIPFSALRAMKIVLATDSAIYSLRSFSSLPSCYFGATKLLSNTRRVSMTMSEWMSKSNGHNGAAVNCNKHRKIIKLLNFFASRKRMKGKF